jgi:surfactin synthase thioesterase subunit
MSKKSKTKRKSANRRGSTKSKACGADGNSVSQTDDDASGADNISFNNNWIIFGASANRILRIYIFPCAGSMPQLYYDLAILLASNAYEVHLYRHSGRYELADEPIRTSFFEIVSDAVDYIDSFDDKIPIHFVCHSFGVLLSYEICRRLQHNKVDHVIGVLAPALQPLKETVGRLQRNMSKMNKLENLATFFPDSSFEVIKNLGDSFLDSFFMDISYADQWLDCFVDIKVDCNLTCINASEDFLTKGDFFWKDMFNGIFQQISYKSDNHAMYDDRNFKKSINMDIAYILKKYEAPVVESSLEITDGGNNQATKN